MTIKARVELLGHTPDPLSVIYVAFRQCYHAGFVGDMWNDIENEKITREKQADFIRKVVSSGHESPIEHVNFTFALGNVSRALTHQLVRHRIASFSQQSQRYVSAKDFQYITPPSIEKKPEALEKYNACMDTIAQAYEELQSLLSEATNDQSKANEDARFVLPQAAVSNIVVTMNVRSLINFFHHRCCTRAQWEIRSVANQMLKHCRNVLPEIFDNQGAKCEKTKTCPEGKFCCGRYPAVQSVYWSWGRENQNF